MGISLKKQQQPIVNWSRFGLPTYDMMYLSAKIDSERRLIEYI